MPERNVVYQNVVLTCDHTHRGRPYQADDVLRLRDDQVKRLMEQGRCEKAPDKAKPLNVDEDGNLF